MDEWDDTTMTNREGPAVVVQQSRLGWVAFAVALLGLGVSVVLLWVRSDREADRANKEYVERTRADIRAEKAEQAVGAQAAALKALEAKLAETEAARDTALADAKAAQQRAATLERAAPAPAAKAAPKKPKKPVKKKRRR